jgi:hypothetical protein
VKGREEGKKEARKEGRKKKTTRVGKAVEKLQHLCTVGGNAK